MGDTVPHACDEILGTMFWFKNVFSLFSSPRYFGQRSMKVAMNYHLVARTHSCRGDFRAALQSEKEAYAIYKQTVSNRREKPPWQLKINITVGQRRNIVGMYKAYFKNLCW